LDVLRHISHLADVVKKSAQLLLHLKRARLPVVPAQRFDRRFQIHEGRSFGADHAEALFVPSFDRNVARSLRDEFVAVRPVRAKVRAELAVFNGDRSRPATTY
jgi:hypothetical protein